MIYAHKFPIYPSIEIIFQLTKDFYHSVTRLTNNDLLFDEMLCFGLAAGFFVSVSSDVEIGDLFGIVKIAAVWVGWADGLVDDFVAN